MSTQTGSSINILIIFSAFIIFVNEIKLFLKKLVDEEKVQLLKDKDLP